MTHSFASVANNSVHLQSVADYGYYSIEEVAHFVYCLLQKLKKAGTLPPVKQWEEYMTPDQLKFPATKEERFLLETRMLVALEKWELLFEKKVST